MIITPPPLDTVSPGDPITSEGMNNLVGGLKTVYDFLNKQHGTLVVQAVNQADNNPVRGAVVTVAPTGDSTRPPRAAVFAGGSVNAYLVDQLLGGTYEVLVEADGFNPQSQPITMADTGASLTVQIALTVAEARFPLPNLFGQQLSQALATVAAQGFTVTRIIDSHGVDIPPGQVPDEAKALPVLGQWPPSGTLSARNAPLFIHAAATAEVLQQVRVPDLSGLSINDARAVLEASKLTLGTTQTAGPGPVPGPGPGPSPGPFDM
jgi:hypothetical protein